MHLFIKSRGDGFILPLTNGEVIAAFAAAQPCVTEYNKGGGYTYRPCTDQSLELTLVTDAQLTPPTPIMEEMQASRDAAEQRWVTYYNKANAAEKKVAELEAKIAAFTQLAKPTGTDPA